VLCCCEDLELVDVKELQLAVERLEPRQHDVVPAGRPVDAVDSLVRQGACGECPGNAGKGQADCFSPISWAACQPLCAVGRCIVSPPDATRATSNQHAASAKCQACEDTVLLYHLQQALWVT
jgi:hypothetical protein